MKQSLQSQEKKGNWRVIIGWTLAGISLIVVVYYAGLFLFTDLPTTVNLIVYAFSTQEEAFTQGIFPAFEQEWAEKENGELVIEAVFGPSGTLAGQINLGSPADIVLFSNQNHINWLKVGKRVDKNTEPVLITSTPLVIVTRSGNPFGITGFSDLTQPNIQLLHADPLSSGVGEWAILAEYGSEYIQSGNTDSAESQLKGIWQNVRLLSPSARTTMTLFELGAGDALVTYEQDALLAKSRSISLEIILPSSTILARHYAVIVDDNVTSKERQAAEELLAFMISEKGQEIFKRYHFRSVNIADVEYDEEKHLFTDDALGGWPQIYDTLIENLWGMEIQPTLELESVTTLIEGGE